MIQFLIFIPFFIILDMVILGFAQQQTWNIFISNTIYSVLRTIYIIVFKSEEILHDLFVTICI